MSADWRSGLAIRGFDPVAYFVAGAPVPGRTEHEFTHRGATWHFASRANLEAFRRRPEVFEPRYGGYDAEAVARGVLVRSEPGIFLVEGEALYLFRTREARARFAADPALRAAADAAWGTIERDRHD